MGESEVRCEMLFWQWANGGRCIVEDGPTAVTVLGAHDDSPKPAGNTVRPLVIFELPLLISSSPRPSKHIAMEYRSVLAHRCIDIQKERKGVRSLRTHR